MPNIDEDLVLDTDNYVEPTKLDVFKQRATELGITFKANISETTLGNKIKAKEAELLAEAEEDKEEEVPKVSEVKSRAAEVHEHRKRSQLLYRVVLNPVDPRRTQLQGEMVYVGNSLVGMTGKMVPFNVEAGYHIPEIILNDLRNRTHTEFYIFTDKDGNDHTRSRQRKSFVIEVLDTIPEDEFNAIKARQLAQAE